MTIADKMFWRNGDTAMLAKALDEMGFERTVMRFYDRCDARGMNWEDEDIALAGFIEKKVDESFDALWNGSDEMERELIRYRNTLDFDYHQISRAYTIDIHKIESFNAKPRRSAMDAKTSLKSKIERKGGKRKNGY